MITFAELQYCSLSSNYVCLSYHTCFRKEADSWHKDRSPSLQHPLVHPESGCLPISLLPNKSACPTKICPGPICKKMIIANNHISILRSPNKSFASDTVSLRKGILHSQVSIRHLNAKLTGSEDLVDNGSLIVHHQIWCRYCPTSQLGLFIEYGANILQRASWICMARK